MATNGVPAADPPAPSGRIRTWFAQASTPSGLLLSAVLILSLLPVTATLSDPDFWWHLKAGQMLLSLHHLIGNDPFTYTVPSHHWVEAEWLSEVGFAILHQIGGIALFVIVLSIVSWVGILFIYLRSRLDRPNTVVLAAGLVLGLLAGDPIWGPRVQMETFTLACVTLYLVERHLQGRSTRLTWILVPMFLLWSNLHGGFVIGPIFLIAVLAAELVGNWVGWWGSAPMSRIKSLAIISGLATVATAINANGPGILLYAWETQFSPAQQSLIVEWESPNFHYWVFDAFYATLLFSFILMVIINRRIRARDVALALIAIVLSFQSVRHIVFVVAIIVPLWVVQMNMLVERARAWRTAHRKRAPRRRTLPPLGIRSVLYSLLMLVLIGIDCSKMLTTVAPQEGSLFYATNFPVCAARWLATYPHPLKIFNQYGDGGYLAYTLSGQGDKIFIFGDAALMGDPMLYTYADVADITPQWDAILHRYGTQVVVFVNNTPLTDVMLRARDWTVVYRDPHDTVFERTDLLATLHLPPQPVITNPSDPCYQLAHTPPSQWPH